MYIVKENMFEMVILPWFDGLNSSTKIISALSIKSLGCTQCPCRHEDSCRILLGIFFCVEIGFRCKMDYEVQPLQKEALALSNNSLTHCFIRGSGSIKMYHY